MIQPADLMARANTAVGRVVVLAVIGIATGAATRLIGARTVAAVTVAGLGLVALLRWWPGSALAALLVGAGLNRFTFPVAGADVKPEHIAVLLVAAVLAVRGLERLLAARATAPEEQALAPAGWNAVADRIAAVCLVIYLALNALSSLVNAIYPLDSLRQVGLVVLVSMPYFLLPLLLRDAQSLLQTVTGWIL